MKMNDFVRGMLVGVLLPVWVACTGRREVYHEVLDRFELVSGNVACVQQTAFFLVDKDTTKRRVRAHREDGTADFRAVFYRTDSVVVEEFDRFDHYLGKTCYELDASQRCRKELRSNRMNQLVSYAETSFNEEGLPDEQIEYAANGLIKMRHVFVYPPNVYQYSKESSYPMGARAQQKVYTVQGNAISEIQYYNDAGENYQTVRYNYDDDGFLQRERVYSRDLQLQHDWTYTYQLDEKGNWISRTDHYFGVPYYELKRTITYND